MEQKIRDAEIKRLHIHAIDPQTTHTLCVIQRMVTIEYRASCAINVCKTNVTYHVLQTQPQVSY